MNLNLKSLIGKLNDTGRSALEAAAGLCLDAHALRCRYRAFSSQTRRIQDTDIQRILHHYEVDHARLTRDLTRALDRLKTGNARTPALSPHIPRIITEAWNLASIDYGANKVRSGHLLLALLSEDSLSRLAREASAEFQKISVEELHKNLPDLVTGTVEDKFESPMAAESTEPGVRGPTKTPRLGSIYHRPDGSGAQGPNRPRVGARLRDSSDGRYFNAPPPKQSDPYGEAGVGKTAVVEGLALRIAGQDVPLPLRNVALKSLDLTLLQAGAGVKGEFENRLKSVIEEVKASPQPIILFIDEAHTMIGAGGQAGQGDAANILKPALARGELRTIAATTWSEYKKYFEKDAALTRRFQVVKVDEPIGRTGCGDAARADEHAWKLIITSGYWMMPWMPPFVSRIVTSPAGNCRTRQSVCWIPPPPELRWAK